MKTLSDFLDARERFILDIICLEQNFEKEFKFWKKFWVKHDINASTPYTDILAKFSDIFMSNVAYNALYYILRPENYKHFFGTPKKRLVKMKKNNKSIKIMDLRYDDEMWLGVAQISDIYGKTHILAF